MKRTFVIRLFISVFIYILFFPIQVSANWSHQRRLFDGNIGYFNIQQQMCDGSASVQMSGSDNIAKIFNFLTSKGLKDYQAAGVLGNMWAESGFEPQRQQGVFDHLVPAEEWTNINGGGWGLVQWTPGSKMIEPVRAAGKNPNDLGVQLEYLWGQLTNEWPSGWGGGPPTSGFNEKEAGDHLKSTADVADATISFETKYERHAGSPQPERVVEAERILNLARQGAISSTTSAGSFSGDLYILGDSITVRAANSYKASFSPQGVNPIISAVSGRSWSSAGNPDVGAEGTQGSGKEAVEGDREKITQASGIVVALGTNGYSGSNPVDEIVSTLRSINQNAPIWWVNVANGPPGNAEVPAFNAKLQELESDNKIKVINWAKSVDPSSDGTNNPSGLLDDGTHPKIPEGVDQLTSLVTSAVMTGGALSNSGTGGCSTSSAGSGDVIATAVEYSWPQWKGRGFTERKPEYEAAINEAKQEGRYVGGCDGVDCGGFVTTAMIDSGYETDYNYGGKGGNTVKQMEWLEANWQNLGQISDTSALQPGDVAINSGHTFLYIGIVEGFETQVASASLCSRAPMAGREALIDSSLTWYRKK